MKSLCVIAILFLALAIPARAGDRLLCQDLDYRQGRVYFPVGNESLVFVGARFTLLPATGEPVSGTIEHTWQGISVSERMPDSIAAVSSDSAFAVIETAWLDSTTNITVGSILQNEQPVWLPGRYPANSSRISVSRYSSEFAIVGDFEWGLTDGYLSFRRLPTTRFSTKTISTQHGALVALVPGKLGADGDRSLLTTALYYLYDSSRLLMFVGMSETRGVVSFLAPDSATNRRFPVDPEKGRRLLRSALADTDTIRISYEDPVLVSVAHLFAELWVMERKLVEFVAFGEPADLSIVFVPIDPELPSAGLHSLYQRMAADTVAGSSQAEAVRFIETYFHSAENASDHEQYRHYLRQIEHRLIDDLGCFPLFRPTLFFTFREHLRNVRFTESGQLDLTDAAFLRLPEPDSTEAGR